MKIAGLQKLTLLDYPGHTACTVFTAGCNFRCPFCHNSDLLRKNEGDIRESEFFEFLLSRRAKLDGVCITGGEPLLQPDILEFMQKIRDMGFLVKLDTNGSIYDKLHYIVNNKMCDYIAMDIKNAPEKYNLTAGGMINIDNVKQSVNLLLNQNFIDYEFRTTVVKELHDKSDFKAISAFIAGAKRYFLQQYKDSEKVLDRRFSAYSESEMLEIMQYLQVNGVKNTACRGF